MKKSFKEIKQSYLEIKEFLEDKSSVKVKNLNTKIAEDLELLGDDNYFLLEEFVDKYHLNYDDFNYEEYFESECELFNPNELFFGILLLPFSLIERGILYFYPQIKTPIISYYSKKHQKRKDLTFGDLIIWKLNGKFCLRKSK